MCQTSLTAVCYVHTFCGTGIAGKFNDINERRSIVSFCLVSSFNAIGYRGMLCSTAVWQTHCQTQAFAYNCTLQKYIVSEISGFSRNNLIWKFFHTFLYRPFGMISHTGYFCKNFVTDFLNSGFDASHDNSSLCL